MFETNESKMKVVGKSAEAVNRVVDILMGVDAEFRVLQQGLVLSVRSGVKDFDAQSHWWMDDAEFDDETGFWSLELEGDIDPKIGFPAICQALDVGIELYTADREHLVQKYLAVSHLGVVTSESNAVFDDPEDMDGKSDDASATKQEPDEWGWGYFGFFEPDEKVYAGAS